MVATESDAPCLVATDSGAPCLVPLQRTCKILEFIVVGKDTLSSSLVDKSFRKKTCHSSNYTEERSATSNGQFKIFQVCFLCLQQVWTTHLMHLLLCHFCQLCSHLSPHSTCTKIISIPKLAFKTFLIIHKQ